MSGSGGGGGGGVGDAAVSCDRLLFRTHLTSLEPRFFQRVRQDDLLEVVLEAETGTTIIARAPDGEAVGAVTSGKHAQLLACLRAGHQFLARVVTVTAGVCEVEVRPRD